MPTTQRYLLIRPTEPLDELGMQTLHQAGHDDEYDRLLRQLSAWASDMVAGVPYGQHWLNQVAEGKCTLVCTFIPKEARLSVAAVWLDGEPVELVSLVKAEVEDAG